MSLTFSLQFCVFLTVLYATLSDSHRAHSKHERLANEAQLTTRQEAPEESPKPEEERKRKDYQIGRLFFISDKAPAARTLEKNQTFINASIVLENYIDYIEQSTLRVLKASDRRSNQQTFYPCNNRAQKGLNSVDFFFYDRGLPPLDVSCYTDFEGVVAFTNETAPHSADEVFDAMSGRQTALHYHRKEIADLALGNWSKPDTNLDFLYNITSKQCVLNFAVGVRVGPNWHFGTTVTNTGRNENVPLFKRFWLSEYLTVSDSGTKLEALRFLTRVRPDDNATDQFHYLRNDTTTSLTAGGGSLGPFAFLPQYPEQNIALIAAIDKSDLAIQQVDDALAPASFAILFLPLLLNVVPIALLAEVETLTMMVYMLLSDVVTVIPLCIKGVELIIIANQPHRATHARFTANLNGELADSASVEMWSAECKARDYVVPFGISFVVVAVMFMFIGIGLELLARFYLKKRRMLARAAFIENEPFLKLGIEDEWALPPMDGPVSSSVGARPSETGEPSSVEYSDVRYEAGDSTVNQS